MLRLTREDIVSLRDRLTDVRDRGAAYFEKANPTKAHRPAWHDSWKIGNNDIWIEAETLRDAIKALCVEIAGAARGSPLLAEADTQALRHNMRQMLANIWFLEYHHTGVHIHHDEDVVLGVDPPSHGHVPFEDTAAALKRFDEAATDIRDLIDLLSPTDTVPSISSDTSSYRPNTAFIMMAIDNNNPELEDIKNGIKEVLEEKGVLP